jgi:hypothetical protein
MKKILIAFMLFAGTASGQTYNVSVTNSLLGPVTLVVSGTVNNVTNEFAPVNNITNEFQSIVSVTNIIGETTINNTNIFTTFVSNDVDVAGVTVTNNTIFEGTFTQTIITNLITQFLGVNVFAPTEVSTNVTDTWTIELTTNYAVGTYLQTGNITSVVFSVDSTNDVALGEVLLQATTNTISWPTNGLAWAAGSAPTLTTGQWSILYFRAWRDDVHAVYVGDSL